jgi:hypothetical protein
MSVRLGIIFLMYFSSLRNRTATACDLHQHYKGVCATLRVLYRTPYLEFLRCSMKSTNIYLNGVFALIKSTKAEIARAIALRSHCGVRISLFCNLNSRIGDHIA